MITKRITHCPSTCVLCHGRGRGGSAAIVAAARRVLRAALGDGCGRNVDWLSVAAVAQARCLERARAGAVLSAPLLRAPRELDGPRSALAVAVEEDKHEYVALLLTRGADPNAVRVWCDDTPLVICAGFRGNTRVAQLLLAHGAHVDGIGIPLIEAARNHPISPAPAPADKLMPTLHAAIGAPHPHVGSHHITGVNFEDSPRLHRGNSSPPHPHVASHYITGVNFEDSPGLHQGNSSSAHPHVDSHYVTGVTFEDSPRLHQGNSSSAHPHVDSQHITGVNFENSPRLHQGTSIHTPSYVSVTTTACRGDYYSMLAPSGIGPSRVSFAGPAFISSNSRSAVPAHSVPAVLPPVLYHSSSLQAKGIPSRPPASLKSRCHAIGSGPDEVLSPVPRVTANTSRPRNARAQGRPRAAAPPPRALVRSETITQRPTQVVESLTALGVAAYRGHLELVKLLLRHGADVHHVEAVDGCSILHLAAQGSRSWATNHSLISKLLLLYGANPCVRDYSGKTPSQTAMLAGDQTLAAFLEWQAQTWTLRKLRNSQGAPTVAKIVQVSYPNANLAGAAATAAATVAVGCTPVTSQLVPKFEGDVQYGRPPKRVRLF